MTRLAFFLLILAGTAHAIEPSRVPTVVELFTSKYCPSCPAAEAYLQKAATEDSSLLVVMENVDYWDKPGQKDPHSNPDFTQRQYDYSNKLAERPGLVFTPQPIINGKHVAEPPLWINWSRNLATAKTAAAPLPLQLSTNSNGDLLVSLPASLDTKQPLEMWFIGMEKESGSSMWRAKGVRQGQIEDGTMAFGPPRLPSGSHLLVLVQKSGPEAVVAAGTLAR